MLCYLFLLGLRFGLLLGFPCSTAHCRGPLEQVVHALAHCTSCSPVTSHSAAAKTASPPNCTLAASSSSSVRADLRRLSLLLEHQLEIPCAAEAATDTERLTTVSHSCKPGLGVSYPAKMSPVSSCPGTLRCVYALLGSYLSSAAYSLTRWIASRSHGHPPSPATAAVVLIASDLPFMHSGASLPQSCLAQGLTRIHPGCSPWSCPRAGRSPVRGLAPRGGRYAVSPRCPKYVVLPHV